jgi:hypothetical protein
MREQYRHSWTNVMEIVWHNLSTSPKIFIQALQIRNSTPAFSINQMQFLGIRNILPRRTFFEMSHVTRRLFHYCSIRFLGAFSNLRKGTNNLVMSVRSSVHMELGSHWTYFNGIWYLRTFSKICRENQGFIYNLTRTTGTLHGDLWTFMIITSSIFHGMRSVSAKVVKKFKTHFLHKFFPKIVPFMKQCGKIWWSLRSHRWQYNKAHEI